MSETIKIRIVLFLLVLFHGLNIAERIDSNIVPDGKAWSTHYIEMIKLTERMDCPRGILSALRGNGENPPLYYCVGALSARLFHTYKAALFTSGIFFIILILCVYGIGKRMIDERGGLAAAIVCSFFPYIYKSAAHFNLEIATVSMTALIIYLLLQEDVFSLRRKAVLLGVCIGIGMLTRCFLLFFIIGPIGVVFYRNFKRVSRENGRNIPRLLLIAGMVVITASAVCAPFYIQPEFYKIALGKSGVPLLAADSRIFFLEDRLYYLKAILPQLEWGGVSALVISAVFGLRKPGVDKIFLLSWLTIPIAVFTFVPKRDVEYTLACVPVFAVLIAWGSIKGMQKKSAERFIPVMVAAMICLYFAEFWKSIRSF